MEVSSFTYSSVDYPDSILSLHRSSVPARFKLLVKPRFKSEIAWVYTSTCLSKDGRIRFVPFKRSPKHVISEKPSFSIARLQLEENDRWRVESPDLHQPPNDDVVQEETHQLATTLWARIKKKHRINSHLIIHCPMSEGVSEVSERASERSGARERSE